MEQLQACSTSHRFMAAPLQGRTAGGWSWRQALCTGVPAAETSTHLGYVFASHHGVGASLVDQSEVHDGFRCSSKKMKEMAMIMIMMMWIMKKIKRTDHGERGEKYFKDDGGDWRRILRRRTRRRRRR